MDFMTVAGMREEVVREEREWRQRRGWERGGVYMGRPWP